MPTMTLDEVLNLIKKAIELQKYNLARELLEDIITQSGGEPKPQEKAMKYDKTIEDAVRMQIDDDNIVTLTALEPDGTAYDTATQQIEAEEVDKIIKEFEDDSGDSMFGPDSVFEKYPALQGFRP